MCTTRPSGMILERYSISIRTSGMISGREKRFLRLEVEMMLKKYSTILIEELWLRLSLWTFIGNTAIHYLISIEITTLLPLFQLIFDLTTPPSRAWHKCSPSIQSKVSYKLVAWLNIQTLIALFFWTMVPLAILVSEPFQNDKYPKWAPLWKTVTLIYTTWENFCQMLKCPSSWIHREDTSPFVIINLHLIIMNSEALFMK